MKKTPEQLRAGVLRCIENQLCIGADKLSTEDFQQLLAEVKDMVKDWNRDIIQDEIAADA